MTPEHRSKHHDKTRALGLAAGLLMVLSGGAAWAEEALDEVSTFDIPAQPLAQALLDFSQQADMQIVMASTTVKGMTAEGISGERTNRDALELLLDDQGLKYTQHNDRTVAIQQTAAVTENPSLGKTRPASRPVLMAQNRTPTGRNQTNRTDTTTNESKAPPQQIEEIIVVGSQIRGAGPVGANVITLDRTDIELSGFATTQEILGGLPQNFGGGPNEDVEGVGNIGGQGNVAFGSSIDLRGLGTGSTLMLVNGRRLAPGGQSGDFVDINSIPLSAVERVEVLPDGASAIYGSDAIAGVINVILREDYEGAETSVRYAPGISDIDEFQFSQVFGKSWSSGNVIFTYDYYDQDRLRSADRAYTRDSDLTDLGGTNHDIGGGTPGNFLNLFTGQPDWAIPTGQDGTALAPSDLIDLSQNPDAVNRQNQREGSDVMPTHERHSAYIGVNQQLASAIDLFAEVRYSTREFEFLNPYGPSGLKVPSSNAFFVEPPGNVFPFVVLQYNFVDDYGNSVFSGGVDSSGAALGVTFDLANEWELEISGSRSVETTTQHVRNVPNRALLNVALADPDPATAFNPFGDGSSTNPATLAAIEGFLDRDLETELNVFNVLADGDIFDLPGGSAKLAIGGQFRTESLHNDAVIFTGRSDFEPRASIVDLDRDISAAFAELYLPIVSEQNSRPGIKRLTVSIAARYEKYSDFGSNTDPKLGVAWSPTNSVTLRSTVGTSFKAPLLTELGDDRGRAISLFPVPDPASPTGSTNAIFLGGNNPDLDSQEGTSWTAGLDIAPTSLPGFRASLTYFDTEVDGLIANPTNTTVFVILRNPDIFSSVIRRIDPTNADDLAAVTALMNDPVFINQSAVTTPDQVGAIVDNRLSNLAKAEIAGLDFNVAHAFDTGLGKFDLSLNASHLIHFRRQLANGPSIDVVDTFHNPVSLRVRGGLAWNNGGLNAALFGNHIGDYKDTLSSPERTVSSWTTWDLQLGYDFSEGNAEVLEGAKLSLNIQNMFEKDPPFVDLTNGVGYDAINANALGRFASLQFAYTW